jgi:hypothetical protein
MISPLECGGLAAAFTTSTASTLLPRSLALNEGTNNQKLTTNNCLYV